MKIKILLLLLLVTCISNFAYSQEVFFYSGDKKIKLNENAEKFYLKLEGKVEENRLTQLGFSSRETISEQ